MNRRSTQILSFKSEDLEKQEGKKWGRQETKKTNKKMICCWINRSFMTDPKE
jgi:hypothetical protein